MKRRGRSSTPCYDFHGLRVADVAVRLHGILGQHQRNGGTVEIVHGKGEGLLADEIARCARNDPRVVDCYRSAFNEGVTYILVEAGRTAPPPPRRENPSGFYPDPPIRRRKAR